MDSIWSMTRFIFFMVSSSGSSVVISTPASFNSSIGYFECPPDKKCQVALSRPWLSSQHLFR